MNKEKGKKTMYKKDEEIVLRDFCANDIDYKIRWINNPDNNKYLHYNIPLEYEKTLEWFEKKDNSTRIDCLIEYDGNPVGVIGILNIDKTNMKAEYYITIGNTDYKRKGIGYRATKMLLEYAFNDLNLNKVYLIVDADNEAACSLYEKIGFVEEGYFKKDIMRKGKLIDRIRYSILKKDFMR